jgi:hypothetical protein
MRAYKGKIALIIVIYRRSLQPLRTDGTCETAFCGYQREDLTKKHHSLIYSLTGKENYHQ